MKETVYNLFAYTSKELIHEIGGVSHETSGNDEEKRHFLQENVEVDHPRALRRHLPTPVSVDRYIAMTRLGRQLELFNAVLSDLGAPRDILYCATLIDEGLPRIDVAVGTGNLRAMDLLPPNYPVVGDVPDWLTMYSSGRGLDIGQLIRDDYFSATVVLFQSGHYVSCVKLLVSFVDTVAFLTFGDDPGVFTKWLNQYADLSKIRVTADELWEMRNSILHMTSLDSRKVLGGKVRRVGFCVAPRGHCSPPEPHMEYFNLLDLVDTIAQAVEKWALEFNSDGEKLITFVMRYDRLLSDHRKTAVLPKS